MNAKEKQCECGQRVGIQGYTTHVRSKLHKERMAVIARGDKMAEVRGLGSMPERPSENIKLNDYAPSLEKFLSGAVRRKTPGMRIDLIPLEALIALGERLYFGAEIRGYGERNWEKGIPYENLINHAYVHLATLSKQIIKSNDLVSWDIMNEDGPRQNAAAVMWNMMALIHFLACGNPAEDKK